MKKTKKTQETKNKPLFIKVGLGIIAFLTILQLIICYFLISLGSDFKVLEKKLSTLREENKIITERLSKEISLSKISQKAEEMGFVRTVVVLHLNENQAVALK